MKQERGHVWQIYVNEFEKRWLDRVERKTEENFEDESEWTSKDRYNKTEVERCNTETGVHERVRRTEGRSRLTRLDKLDNENAMRRPQIEKIPK